ncbi:hypothetical protein MIND_01152900 [Mycena indigotica]|uniref:Uncharacterized protein n=1 Tax=Mycena indigotica TaxID=2126181 RepID=A0A8H6S5Q5_9AGAR|nr:uncharacterized protein MIND_01152900 [Mycena indigotica]KAF7292556.1 hypothetical protein MIND_01152900 [Mycena indigotica]
MPAHPTVFPLSLLQFSTNRPHLLNTSQATPPLARHITWGGPKFVSTTPDAFLARIQRNLEHLPVPHSAPDTTKTARNDGRVPARRDFPNSGGPNFPGSPRAQFAAVSHQIAEFSTNEVPVQLFKSAAQTAAPLSHAATLPPTPSQNVGTCLPAPVPRRSTPNSVLGLSWHAPTVRQTPAPSAPPLPAHRRALPAHCVVRHALSSGPFCAKSRL